MSGDDLSTLECADAGVIGNARLTGMLGAALFVLLAAEGFMIRGVNEHLTLHVFIGMMLVPLLLLKTASTGYRIVRYYRGSSAYLRKGPPPFLLRVLGPLVVVFSLAVVATGAIAILSGRDSRWLQMHKATFIVWFFVMTVHVLGHFIETTRLAVADIAPRERISGATTRVAVVLTALLLGIMLAVATRGLVDNWQHHRVEEFGTPGATQIQARS